MEISQSLESQNSLIVRKSAGNFLNHPFFAKTRLEDICEFRHSRMNSYASAQEIFSRTQGIVSVRRGCREFGVKSDPPIPTNSIVPPRSCSASDLRAARDRIPAHALPSSRPTASRCRLTKGAFRGGQSGADVEGLLSEAAFSHNRRTNRLCDPWRQPRAPAPGNARSARSASSTGFLQLATYPRQLAYASFLALSQSPRRRMVAPPTAVEER